MAEVAPAPRQGGVLTLQVKDKPALYAAYMPFVIGGGLFIPTNREFAMGQEVFILLHIMEESDRLPIAGKVVWKTPPNSEAHRISGIGVQFNVKDGKSIDARNKIETYLAGALESDRPTHTM
ncbi:MAG: PilZ domain-containing protein [Methylococcales bacterium]|nr:PilZ domain-containing protein [Methylococcales bacterium]MDP3008116.1 PilZ domain-containing protein [Methylococcales bacterium]MDP3840471.1 PilZ domain-containing protein [Methylococcales bacterium]